MTMPHSNNVDVLTDEVPLGREAPVTLFALERLRMLPAVGWKEVGDEWEIKNLIFSSNLIKITLVDK